MIKIIVRRIDQYKIIYEYFTFCVMIVKLDDFFKILNVTSPDSFTSYINLDTYNKLKSVSLKIECINTAIFSCPISLCLEITKSCNLSCRYCFALNESSYNGFNYEIINRINECHNLLSIVISGGEPLLSSAFLGIMEKLNCKNKLITIDTNGTILYNVLTNNSTLLNKIMKNQIIIRVSLDCHIKEINNKTRGHFDDVIKSIKFLINKNQTLRINTVINIYNCAYLNDFALYLYKIGIKHWNLFRLNKYSDSFDELSVPQYIEDKIVREITYNYIGKLQVSYVKNDATMAHFIIDNEGHYIIKDPVQNITRILGHVSYDSISDAWSKMDNIPHLKRYIH